MVLMTIKEHWQGARSILMWLLIIGLSLYVFNDWKNDTIRNDARKRFYEEKMDTIFKRVYYMLEEESQTLKEDKYAERIIEELDYLMVFSDEDYQALSEEEKNNFLHNMGFLIKAVAKENLNPDPLPPPAVIVSEDFADKVAGDQV